MQSILDVDILLLFALALASKRHPAELVELIAAIDVIEGSVPSERRLLEAFSRLAKRGLICEQAGAYALTPEGQAIMANPSRKVDIDKRIPGIKEKLAGYAATSDTSPIKLTAKQVCTAILAHRATRKLPGKNLLAPKPNAAVSNTTRSDKSRRKPMPARRRKD